MSKILNISLLILFLFSGFIYSQNNVSYAVLSLRALGISDSEAQILTDRLRTNLVNIKGFRVLERGNMDEILKEQGFQLTGCTTTECAVEAGKLLNVNKILTGSVGKFSLIYTISLKIIDIETGEIENSIYYDFKGQMEDLLYKGINNSLRRLLGQLVLSGEQYRKVDTKSGFNVGDKALQFQFRTISNDSYSLSDFCNISENEFLVDSRSIVILHFWSSYRFDCSESFKLLLNLQDEFSYKKIKVLHINYGQPRDRVVGFADKFNISINDTVTDEEKEISHLYEVEIIPTIIVIDQLGIIQKRVIELNDGLEIKALLNNL